MENFLKRLASAFGVVFGIASIFVAGYWLNSNLANAQLGVETAIVIALVAIMFAVLGNK